MTQLTYMLKGNKFSKMDMFNAIIDFIKNKGFDGNWVGMVRKG